MVEVKKFRSKNVAIVDVEAVNVLDVDDDKEIRVKMSGSDGANQVGVDNDGEQTVKISGSDGVSQVIVDAVSSALVDIDFEHHEVHEGDAFVCRGFTDIASVATFDILFVVPDSAKLSHFVFNLINEIEIEYLIYRDTEVSDNGTPLLCINRNHNSLTTAGTGSFHTPTVTAVGDLIFNHRFGSGRSIGGNVRSLEENVLKRNSNYLFRIINRINGTANLFNYIFSWYEHVSVS